MAFDYTYVLFFILKFFFQVAALTFGDFYNAQYVKMYTIFMVQLQVCLHEISLYFPTHLNLTVSVLYTIVHKVKKDLKKIRVICLNIV